MPPSKKRGRGRPPSISRPRKKQKRLDAIVDNPPAASAAAAAAADDNDSSNLRRSSRVRRPPQVLDSSPSPSARWKPKSKLLPSSPLSNPTTTTSQSMNLDADTEDADWKSRLRSRDRKTVKRKLFSVYVERQLITPMEILKPSINAEKGSSNSSNNDGKKKKKKKKKKKGKKKLFKRKSNSSNEVVEVAEKMSNDDNISQSNGQEEIEGIVEEEKIGVNSELHFDACAEKVLESPRQFEDVMEVAEPVCEERPDGSDCIIAEEVDNLDNIEAEFKEHSNSSTPEGEGAVQEALKNEDLVKDHSKTMETVKENSPKGLALSNVRDRPRIKEGRRCGLCGGGTGGKPPKTLVEAANDSDNEAYEGTSASEEPNYDAWDGFGDDPGWLGKLMGPIRDSFGIARVWVHLYCAVWSPEVYVAGSGYLKNVRAALYRGRALKCSRCGRPGATIGCRVDRCPKTYHLPCSRAEGCIFDHRKFLIACGDHRRLFQPYGNNYNEHVRRMKAKKLKLELRKFSNDAKRKDLEDEDKWLENCGEDEEFLKRESKRLQRDMLRIAPVYIGGSSEDFNKQYQGWESVAGLQDVVQCMKEVVMIPLLYPEFFSTMGITPPRGVLLHGYPGTGKTLVVRALIGACSRGDKRIAYFARKGADCLGKYVGDAERQLRLLFQVAEKSQPSIIFFDEIDGLAPRRSRSQDQTHSSVVSTLLSLLDGLKSRGSVIVIGATNRPDAIDPALRRPGRFDREIYFPLPSVKDRSAILELHTKSWPNPLSEPLLSLVANQTSGYAGADLQSLCTQAAMNALKRNCGLQELLSSIEKGSKHEKLPPLPSFQVEERDWLEALASASPPCSRREAGMAANDIISSPLPVHLISCLLQPLVYLLISIYTDERIWLPHPLLKASKSIRTVVSPLSQENDKTIGFWCRFQQEPDVEPEIRRILSRYGLLDDPSAHIPSFEFDDHNNLECYKTVKKYPYQWQRSLGFRALIAGASRSGQQHLASCLLHGLMGHIQIEKVNLATLSQEGHGDVIRGLTQILTKCLNADRCIIYMPRIDLWAIDETHKEEVVVEKCSPKEVMPSASVVHDSRKCASEAWSSFIEQVDSVSSSASITIVATCEVANHDLPNEVRQFFTSHFFSSTGSVPSDQTVPRFSVDLDGSFNLENALNTAAEKLARDLARYYFQLIHHETHVINSLDYIKGSDDMHYIGHKRQEIGRGQTRSVLHISPESEPIASANVYLEGGKQSQQDSYPKRSLLPSTEASTVAGAQLCSIPGQLSRNLSSRPLKDCSSLAISAFGYQVLSCPQFAELCWLTSKLEDGPCTDVSGPWKGWPFNSCLMNASSSSEKISSVKDTDSSFTVRGLVAVGLLAYKGAYASVKEVSLEVRRVLELLVRHIRSKILDRRDKYRYVRLLSQVAYLEDMVNSWAYTLRSFQIGTQGGAPNIKAVDLGRISTDNGNSDMQPETSKNSNNSETARVDGSQETVITIEELVDFNKGLITSAIPTADGKMEPNAMISQTPLYPLPQIVKGDSTMAANNTSGSGHGNQIVDANNILVSDAADSVTNGDSVVVNDEDCVCHHTIDSGKDGYVSEQVDICYGEEGTFPQKVDGKHEYASIDVGIDSSRGGSVHGEVDTVLEATAGRRHSQHAGVTCSYSCCLECLNVIHLLALNILSDHWKSSHHDLTVDDLHDVVTSCSLNIVAAFTKNFSSRCNGRVQVSKDENNLYQPDLCGCYQITSIGNAKGIQQENWERNGLLPTECSCHMANEKNSATAEVETNAHTRPALEFFFRDGLVLSSTSQDSTVLHCKYENVCVCPIAKIMLMSKNLLE